MLTIEGSQGEGGGQILRTSLELSLVTRQPFRLDHIRARRQKPGLLRQHLTAVEAARTVGGAEAVGATLGSQTLEFRPGAVTPGNEHVTEIFTSFGECGRSAEEVAHEATDAASAWLRANVPVDEHLADQLLLPMALADGGSFRTVKPSLPSTTNASIIQRFLPVVIRFEQETAEVWRVVVTGQSMSNP